MDDTPIYTPKYACNTDSAAIARLVGATVLTRIPPNRTQAIDGGVQSSARPWRGNGGIGIKAKNKESDAAPNPRQSLPQYRLQAQVQVKIVELSEVQINITS
jgi:hypothetical protein